MSNQSAGAKFRAAVQAEKPLQVIGTINAYHARLAERVGLQGRSTSRAAAWPRARWACPTWASARWTTC